MKTQHKYIYYREDKQLYSVKINVAGKSINCTAKTLEKALELRDDIMSTYRMDKSILVNIVNKKVQPEIDPLLEKAICKWYETYKRPVLGIKTQEGWDAAVYNRIIPAFGKLDIGALSRDTVQAWVFALQKHGNHFTGKGLNSESVRYILKKLSCFYKYLINNGAVKKNPCTEIQFIADLHKEKRPLLPEEISMFLEYVKQNKTPALYTLYRLYFETGARRGEILGLRWCDIDFENQRIHIQWVAQKDKHGKVFFKEMPKTLQSIRWIPINQLMTNLLRGLYEYEEKYTVFSMQEKHIFHYKNKDYMNPDQVGKNFKNWCSLLGIDGVSLHCTRHTLATRLIQSGVPISTVQKIGGWKKPQILLEYYSHVTEMDMRMALKQLKSR